MSFETSGCSIRLTSITQGPGALERVWIPFRFNSPEEGSSSTPANRALTALVLDTMAIPHRRRVAVYRAEQTKNDGNPHQIQGDIYSTFLGDAEDCQSVAEPVYFAKRIEPWVEPVTF